MRLQIHHRTIFRYAGPAYDSYNEVRLRPSDDAAQHCVEFRLTIQPATEPRQYEDFYGNAVHTFEVPAPHDELLIEAMSTVETQRLSPLASVPVVTAAEYDAWSEREMFAEFFSGSQYVPLEPGLAAEAFTTLQEAGGRTHVWSDVQVLGHHVYRSCSYEPNVTTADTPATVVAQSRKGVCQDFAHLHLGLCRSLGIAARYVSGYFYNTTRRAREVEASHAWIEVNVPGYGWIGWDPTHGRATDERYVKVAVGRDYADIRPVNGTYRGGPGLTLEVEVNVRLVDA